MRRWLPWLFPPVVVVAALWFALGGPRWNPRVPLAFDGDALFYLAQAKSTADNGWWWNNPLIGAPLGLHALTFPQNTNVDQVIVWVVSRFTTHIGLIGNVSWIAMVALSALTATWGLRRLGVSAAVAGVGAIIFALTPFALYRHIGHFALVIYLLPIPATIAILLASGAGEDNWSTRRWIIPLAGCVLVGFDYIYFAFFGAFLILVATVCAAAAGARMATIRKGALCLSVIAVATALNLAPNAVAWRTYGRPVGVTHFPAESEIYGLKIRHLFSPTSDTWFSPLQTWRDRERSANFPNENENISARLGVVTAAGFAGLLAVLIFPSAAPADERRRRLRAAALLAMAAVLLATVGGLGSLFSLFLTADVRSYNRISPFIAFFSVAGLAWWLDRSREWLATRVWLALVSTVLLVALIDQMPALRSRRLAGPSIEADYSAVSATVATLERVLPDQAMVFQLPTRPYPLDPGGIPIGVYTQFKPYMTSHHLRWSYPILNPDQLKWEQDVLRQPTADWPRYLAQQGFAAILITRNGYADGGEQLVTQLTDPAAGATMLATSERYLALDIRSLRKK